jgi:hypothetical protein
MEKKRKRKGKVGKKKGKQFWKKKQKKKRGSWKKMKIWKKKKHCELLL